MTPDLQQEFQLLSAKAKQQLKNIPASGSCRHVFSLWTMPSFSPSYRWTIFSPVPRAKESRPFASYTVWRSDLDWEKFRSPVERLRHPKELAPTVEDEEVWLTEDIIQGFEQGIRGIAIPFFLGSPSVVGCDGTMFEFQYDELFFGGSLHWWEDYPREWRPVTEAITKIAVELENRRKLRIHPDASPNGGPAMPVGNSEITGRPPS